jgi:hypothetical protein
MKHSQDIGRQTHPQFATVQGERWRRFLERVGTHSNDFANRPSRAPFAYLQQRAISTTTWSPL